MTSEKDDTNPFPERPAEQSARHSDPIRGKPPGWYKDPTGRHDHWAWWSGTQWTGATSQGEMAPSADAGTNRKWIWWLLGSLVGAGLLVGGIAAAAVWLAAQELAEIPPWGPAPDVIVFLDDWMLVASGNELTDEGRSLLGELSGMPGVSQAWFVDKATAHEEFRDIFANDSEMLDWLDENPSGLPASLRFLVHDRQELIQLARAAREHPGVIRVESTGSESA